MPWFHLLVKTKSTASKTTFPNSWFIIENSEISSKCHCCIYIWLRKTWFLEDKKVHHHHVLSPFWFKEDVASHLRKIPQILLGPFLNNLSQISYYPIIIMTRNTYSGPKTFKLEISITILRDVELRSPEMLTLWGYS